MNEPIKRNCWTCAHDAPPDPNIISVVHACQNYGKRVQKWAHKQPMDRTGMPSKDADNCPGYEPRS